MFRKKSQCCAFGKRVTFFEHIHVPEFGKIGLERVTSGFSKCLDFSVIT